MQPFVIPERPTIYGKSAYRDGQANVMVMQKMISPDVCVETFGYNKGAFWILRQRFQ